MLISSLDRKELINTLSIVGKAINKRKGGKYYKTCYLNFDIDYLSISGITYNGLQFQYEMYIESNNTLWIEINHSDLVSFLKKNKYNKVDFILNEGLNSICIRIGDQVIYVDVNSNHNINEYADCADRYYNSYHPNNVLEGLLSTLDFVSTDQTTPSMCGVQWNIKDNNLIIHGTNGAFLSKQVISNIGINSALSVTIPLEIAKTLIKVLKSDESIFIAFTDEPRPTMYCRVGNLKLKQSLMQAIYPSVGRVFPAKSSLELITLPKEEILDRLSQFVEPTYSLKNISKGYITINEDLLTIKGEGWILDFKLTHKAVGQHILLVNLLNFELILKSFNSNQIFMHLFDKFENIAFTLSNELKINGSYRLLSQFSGD